MYEPIVIVNAGSYSKQVFKPYAIFKKIIFIQKLAFNHKETNHL